MIDLDITLFIQFANFIITLVVLQYLLIRPVREQIRKRKATMDGLGSEVSDFLRKADDEMTTYEASLKSARETAMGLRNSARAEAEVAAQGLLADAAADAQHTVHLAQNAMRAELQSARETLFKDVDAFSRVAVDRLLG